MKKMKFRDFMLILLLGIGIMVFGFILMVQGFDSIGGKITLVGFLVISVDQLIPLLKKQFIFYNFTKETRMLMVLVLISAMAIIPIYLLKP